MQIRIGAVPSVVIGYLLGVFFTPYMFLDLRLTEWYNVFTWCWVLLWPVALFMHFVIWFFSSGAFFFVVLVLFIIFAVAVYNDSRIRNSYRLRR